MRRVLVALILGFSVPQIAWAADEFPIAGLKPSERPAGAPVISSPQRAPDWEKRLFHGVVKPYPKSITSQQTDQGSWYTPFNRPGMRPPFDLRGWTESKAGGKADEKASGKTNGRKS